MNSHSIICMPSYCKINTFPIQMEFFLLHHHQYMAHQLGLYHKEIFNYFFLKQVKIVHYDLKQVFLLSLFFILNELTFLLFLNQRHQQQQPLLLKSLRSPSFKKFWILELHTYLKQHLQVEYPKVMGVSLKLIPINIKLLIL